MTGDFNIAVAEFTQVAHKNQGKELTTDPELIQRIEASLEEVKS